VALHLFCLFDDKMMAPRRYFNMFLGRSDSTSAIGLEGELLGWHVGSK
jgi:hypothetical protein